MCDINLSTSILRSNIRHNQIPTGKCQMEVINQKNVPLHRKTLMSVTNDIIDLHICKSTSIIRFIIIYLHVTTYDPDHQRLVHILTHKTSKLCTSQYYLLHHHKQHFYKKNLSDLFGYSFAITSFYLSNIVT
jgi:hypothetical protein